MEEKNTPLDEQAAAAAAPIEEPSPLLADDATAVFTPVSAPAEAEQAPEADPFDPIDDKWLEDFLQLKYELEHEAEISGEKEIGVDPDAVAAAGLVSPEDRELEQILAEDWDAAAQSAEQEEAAPEEEATEDEAEGEEEEDEPIPDGKKRRPRMKKGYGLLGIPHVLVTLVVLAIGVFIGVQMGNLIWLGVADVMAFGKEKQSVTLTITEEEVANSDMASVAQKLYEAGIVRYPALFEKFATLTGKGARIDPGTYTLGSHLDYNALLNHMVNYGPVMDEVDIMFPEGYNCAQIFALLEEKGVCTVADLEAYAAEGELSDYWFLEGVERGHKYCLEGYLAPDTYTFYTNDEPGRVLEKFLDEFDDRFTDKMKEDFETMQQRYNQALSENGYGNEYIANNPLTLHKLVTLASIVQKETANDAESYNIASVFYNRLTDPASHPYLGSDATVYYAIGDYFSEKDELTQEDLTFDSPYNTRNNKGLPPGPICSPGAYTLYSVLDPNDTEYYYFVYSAEERVHLFAKTLREHENNLKKLGLW